ncbi:MAG: hypothetical protein ABEH90_00640 [Halolamina sp.]
MTDEERRGVDASEWTPPEDADGADGSDGAENTDGADERDEADESDGADGNEWVEFPDEAADETADGAFDSATDSSGRARRSGSSVRPAAGTDAVSGGDEAPPEEPPTGELERPPDAWRGDGDPTDSRVWAWLTRATLFSGLVLALWSVPVALFGAVDRSSLETVSDGTAFVVVGLLLLALLVRLVVLPVLLFLDAGKLREATEVGWTPDRSFYMLVGALFATLACGYYLFKRQRHVGNPALLTGDELLYYEGRTVRSNWFRVVLVAPALAGIGAVGSVLDAAERAHPDLAVALLAPVVLLFALALLVRFVFLPVAFYRDAVAVSRAGAGWEPNGTLYAVVGYVFALPTALVYLYRRHKHTEGLF